MSLYNVFIDINVAIQCLYRYKYLYTYKCKYITGVFARITIVFRKKSFIVKRQGEILVTL